MLDYLGIFKEFNRRKIKYVVVGGLAVNFHGIPRMTYDIDLLVALDDNNLRKLLFLLSGWGFKPKVPVNIMDFAYADKRNDWIRNKNMKAFNVVNPQWAISEIDIIIDSPVDYLKAADDVTRIKVNGIIIPVISRQKLVVMKKQAGRPQDTRDIEYLTRSIP